MPMPVAMAVGAERDQIFTSIVTHLASETNVMNLKMLQSATMLAPPAIAFKHLCA
jgi:hypothetical protein